LNPTKSITAEEISNKKGWNSTIVSIRLSDLWRSRKAKRVKLKKESGTCCRYTYWREEKTDFDKKARRRVRVTGTASKLEPTGDETTDQILDLLAKQSTELKELRQFKADTELLFKNLAYGKTK
jgi:hypothetical protein